MKIDSKSAAYAYEQPCMEVVRLASEDVVRTSPGDTDVPAPGHSASESLLTGAGVQSL